MARATLVTLWLASACIAQTRPATQTTSKPWRDDPDRVYTIDEVLKRFELDQRLSLCHVWERADGTLGGFVEQPQYKAVLERATKKDGSRIKLLPEESKTKDRFGIVTAEHVILREDPEDRPGDRDNVSEVSLGEPVWILDQGPNGSVLVHSSDGYLGWIDSAALWNVEADLFARWVGGGEDHYRRNPFEETKTAITERAADKLHSLIPSVLSQFGKSRADRVIENARIYLDTPYLWGGKTKSGIDCSGLIQVAIASVDVFLPRDADQQANVGKLVATRWFKDALIPGDLLFFVSEHRGNVHHVAIYLGDGKYIEAAGKDVHISSMNPGDADYDAERASTFAWARRVVQ